MGKTIFACFVEISAGITVGSAIAAFITLLQIVPRLTQITETGDYIKLYEYAFTLGATLFSFFYFLDSNFKLSKYLSLFLGLTMGIFVGLFASALAEVLNVIPVFAKKFKVKHEIKFIIGSLIFGKVVGSLFYWLVFIK